jgi:hypothetical protein
MHVPLREVALEIRRERGNHEMRKFFCAVIAAVLFNGFEASAQEVKVGDSHGAYVTKIVTAENVKGVEVRLSKEIIRSDCNTFTIPLSRALIKGSGNGWHDKYILDADLTQTKMYCPLDKPVPETIYSEPLFIKSFANEYVNNDVMVSVVIPEGFKLEVVVK